MKNAIPHFILIIACSFLGGCASSSVSTSTRASAPIPSGRIGLAPGGGVLGDAIAVELFQKGFDIVEPTQMSVILARSNMNEASVSTPESLGQLHAQKIYTLLIVKSAGAYDGLPQSASVRIVNTETGEMVASVNWQNGYGGQAGSMADRMMRADLNDAAHEIANALSRKLTK